MRRLVALLAATLFATPTLAADFTLPPGFKATVFAKGVGKARHLAVRDNGDVIVALQGRAEGERNGLVVLRDRNRDGKSDSEYFIPNQGGTGVAIKGDQLYFGADDAVYRYRLDSDSHVVGTPELIVVGFPQQRQHAAKSLVLDGNGGLYVNVGAPSNACQEKDRQPGSMGQEPCGLLRNSGGVWRYDADTPNQQHLAGARIVTGSRNLVALDWSTAAGGLYGVQHGRDMFFQNWPELFTDQQSAELPGEEFHRLDAGSHLGWPKTYWDQQAGVRRLAPEYGGDGKKIADGYARPLYAFPGHWGPNDLLFYTGSQFPASYRNGAFIAFHGSWNRAPLPQAGYKVMFVPMADGRPSGEPMTFADGFKGKDVLDSPRDAQYRPTGLAQGPDGSLYVADSVKGRIWKISYEGK